VCACVRVCVCACVRVYMKDAEELFSIFTPSGEHLGEKKRHEVHRDGDVHKSVHGFLFTQDGEVLLQRRSMRKDTCPGMIDMSCAEHLCPGESYEQGMVRGLKEELGLSTDDIRLVLVRDEHFFELKTLNGIDREFQATYIIHSDAKLTLDPEEVTAAWFVDPKDLTRDIEKEPFEYTEWMKDEWRFIIGTEEGKNELKKMQRKVEKEKE
jgi:isopentenyldiphosphate isomerase